MKPQDLLVAVRLIIEGKRLSYADLGSSLKISPSEAHAAIQRLTESYLFDTLTNSIRKPALKEFLIHGLQYTFPVSPGKLARGVLTGFSAPVFSKHFSIGKSTEKFVWPCSKGKNRGISIKPLYRTVPVICFNENRFYHWFSVLDMLRINRAREREVALEHLSRLLNI